MRLLLLLFTLWSGVSASQNGLYVGLSGGSAFGDTIEQENATISFEKSYLGELVLGYEYKQFALELEERYVYKSLYSINNYLATGDTRENAQMLNILYSGYNNSKLVSSIGVGVGQSSIKLQNVKQFSRALVDVRNDSILSYQGLFRVAYRVTNSLRVTCSYSYFYKEKSEDFSSMGESSLAFGLRYNF